MMAVPIAQRRKYMLAASRVQTSNIRQAAILGGLVRSAIDHGRLDTSHVRRHVAQTLGRFVNVDRQPPVNAEIAMVLAEFERELGHRFMS